MTEEIAEKSGLIQYVEIGDKSSLSSGGVFFLLCLIPVLATILYGGVDAFTWVLISILAGIMFLAWLTDAWSGRGFLMNRNAILLPLAGLILIGIIQLLPIFNSGISNELLSIPAAKTLSLDPYSTRFFVLRLVIYFIFLAAALTFINTERRLKKMVFIVIVFGSVMAFFGILQRLANTEAIYGLRKASQAIPFASFVNQHHFAAFMEMTGGIVFGFLFGSTMGRDKKTLLAIAAVVMGVAVVLTSSRGGLLSFVGALAFVLIVNYFSKKSGGVESGDADRSMRPFAIIAAGFGGLIVVVGIVLLIGGDTSLIRGVGLSGGEDLTSGRTHFWSVALKIFLDHPLLGVGFDAFGVAFPKYDSWSGVFRIEQVHNDYLQTLTDAGIAGFMCIAAFVYLLFRKGLSLIAGSNDHFRRSAAIGALAGCFGIFVHSFFDFPLRTPSNTFFFLLLVAVATVSVAATDRKKVRDN